MTDTQPLKNLVLRVGETEADAKRAALLAEGNLSHHYHRDVEDRDVALTDHGKGQMLWARGIIAPWVKAHKIKKLVVVHANSRRALQAYSLVFGNDFPAEIIHIPNENRLRSQNYGDWNGLSPKERRDDFANYCNFNADGPYDGRPPRGESKHDVHRRVRLAIEDTDQQMVAQDADACLYLVNKSIVVQSIVANTCGEYVLDIQRAGNGAVVEINRSDNTWRVLHQGYQVIPPAEAALRELVESGCRNDMTVSCTP